MIVFEGAGETMVEERMTWVVGVVRKYVAVDHCFVEEAKAVESYVVCVVREQQEEQRTLNCGIDQKDYDS